jgi:threonine aldolase
MKSLASDNYSSVSPEIFDYLKDEVNSGHARAYGFDKITKKAEEIIKSELDLPNAEIHFVFTGTGANILAMKQCLRSIDSVFVARSSHINSNETGGPENFAGNKLIQINHIHGKIDLEDAEKVILQELDNMPHSPKPRMVSIAQSTEYGTVYSLKELEEIKSFCKKYNLLLHLDMCRAYNAAISLGCELKDIIKAANPDIFSLGGTKNGLMMAEAVVINNPLFQEDFVLLQKQSMQLYSKMRYLSGQYIPFFEQRIWERNAKQANAMCEYLKTKLLEIEEIKITVPVETNHIFAILPKEIIKPLQEEYPFYIWDLNTNEVRFVTSFDTEKEDIDNLIKKLKELLN